MDNIQKSLPNKLASAVTRFTCRGGATSSLRWDILRSSFHGRPMTSTATASCTVVATSSATSTLCSHSMQNNLYNRYIHRSYTACELSATLQEHHGLSEYMLLPRRTPSLIRNCFQRDGRKRVQIPAGTKYYLSFKSSRPALGPIQLSIQRVPGVLSLGAKRRNRRSFTQVHLVARLSISEAILRLPLWRVGIQRQLYVFYNRFAVIS